MYCYLEFNLCYLENLKFFLITVREIFEPIGFVKKSDRFLHSLKAFS